MTEPYELSVAEIVRLIGKRRLSSAELVDSLLKRIAEVEPAVHAWQTLDEAGARKGAQQADRALPAELRGVPFGIKDIIHVAGLPTTASFKPLFDRPVADDATVVGRLREAGAVILGKTVTTQFAYADPSVTRNPWNPERSPGGSSSGSAAAVAARMVPVALGSQTGGSVLRPSAYCGVVGIKPTFGRISRAGVLPVAWSLDHVGVIARSVTDVGLVLQVAAGYDKRDPGSTRWNARDFLQALDRAVEQKPRPPRLGLVRDFFDRSDPEVRDQVSQTIRRFEDAGAQVRELSLPDSFSNILAAHRVIMQSEAAAVHAHSLTEHREHYGPRLRDLVEVGQLLPAAAYLQALRLRHHYRDALRGLLRGIDCFVTPTVSNVAPDPSTTGDASFQSVWSLVGFPSLTIPTGLNSERLPIGTQFVAPPFQESTLIEAGRWCEATVDPIGAPPL